MFFDKRDRSSEKYLIDTAWRYNHTLREKGDLRAVKLDIIYRQLDKEGESMGYPLELLLGILVGILIGFGVIMLGTVVMFLFKLMEYFNSMATTSIILCTVISCALSMHSHYAHEKLRLEVLKLSIELLDRQDVISMKESYGFIGRPYEYIKHSQEELEF